MTALRHRSMVCQLLMQPVQPIQKARRRLLDLRVRLTALPDPSGRV